MLAKQSGTSDALLLANQSAQSSGTGRVPMYLCTVRSPQSFGLVGPGLSTHTLLHPVRLDNDNDNGNEIDNEIDDKTDKEIDNDNGTNIDITKMQPLAAERGRAEQPSRTTT